MDFNENLTINDFNAICRLCLKYESNLQTIFKKDNADCETEQMRTAADEMINICLGLEINPDDGLPLLICCKCSSKLIDNHLFRLQCIAAFNFLVSIKSKQKDVIDNDLLDSQKNSLELKTDYTLPVLLRRTRKNGKSDKTIPQRIRRKTKSSNGGFVPDRKCNRQKSSRNKTKNVNNKIDQSQQQLNLSSDEKKKRKRKGNEGICSTCGKFATNIYTHVRVHDTIQHSFECDYCQKLFTNKYSLLQHFRIHFNERKFQCSLCPYKFLNKFHLSRHMMTHTGEKPHKCNMCTKSFAQYDSLKEHEKCHFQNRKEACPHCDKMFLTKKNLRSHIGIHTGERPFKCDVCGIGFVASSSLTIHRRSHKKDNPNLDQCTICLMVFDDRVMLRSHMRDHGINEVKVSSVKILKI